MVRRKPVFANFHNLRNHERGFYWAGIRRVENMCGGSLRGSSKTFLRRRAEGKCGLYAQATIEKGYPGIP